MKGNEINSEDCYRKQLYLYHPRVFSNLENGFTTFFQSPLLTRTVNRFSGDNFFSIIIFIVRMVHN